MGPSIQHYTLLSQARSLGSKINHIAPLVLQRFPSGSLVSQLLIISFKSSSSSSVRSIPCVSTSYLDGSA
eukprot:scaffold145260_cov28-Cyclotella_meneghiniana.AAC.2